jgi:hypothetical protein
MAAASPAHHTTPTGAAAASERSLQGSMRPWCTIKTTMALLVALLAPLSGSTVAASSAPQLLQAGDAAAAMGDWAQAARSYSAALEADPGAILAYTKRASALAGQGKLSAALKDLGAALEAEPESNQARLQRARLYRCVCMHLCMNVSVYVNVCVLGERVGRCSCFGKWPADAQLLTGTQHLTYIDACSAKHLNMECSSAVWCGGAACRASLPSAGRRIRHNFSQASVQCGRCTCRSGCNPRAEAWAWAGYPGAGGAAAAGR